MLEHRLQPVFLEAQRAGGPDQASSQHQTGWPGLTEGKARRARRPGLTQSLQTRPPWFDLVLKQLQKPALQRSADGTRIVPSAVRARTISDALRRPARAWRGRRRSWPAR